ncbi:tRNA-dihydrouridine synthase [uncultured Deefgea sp.]|uniref:tRNA dihydrouridine synthase n=1 Tax=uncultured Deefgea sp. TaxID=1304914 RepID=UPI0027E59317|nr:tRNA-dihydrouridine synthase [uncultured Deefgea sp.]
MNVRSNVKPAGRVTSVHKQGGSRLQWHFILLLEFAVRILLAPMEGLLDCVLRDVLTRAGGVDLCVTEFVRVSGSVLPHRTFQRIAPELNTRSHTHNGVPVRVQLLGSDAQCLAQNAAKLAELNPFGIDLNFGCPAKTVNRHRGGAILLKEPEVIYQIVSAVRQATPGHIPVTAKMRLGYEDTSQAIDCAQAIASAGAAEVVVHARTKTDGYKPPAYWEWIAEIKSNISIPVVANGEIWTLADFKRCQQISGCDDIMLGRGIVANPGLALEAKLGRALSWPELQPLFFVFWQQVLTHCYPKHQAGRVKQWHNYLRKHYPEAETLFQQIRTLNLPEEIEQAYPAFVRVAD